MPNPNELKLARDHLEKAKWAFERIKSLPRRVGQTVTWANGIVWRRLGDNRWEIIAPELPASGRWTFPWPYTSSLVISGAFAEETS